MKETKKQLLVPLIIIITLLSITGSFGQVSRISFSSAGGSNNGMPVSMGETFIGSGKGMGLGSIKADTFKKVVKSISPINFTNQIEMFPNPATNNVVIKVTGSNSYNFTVKVFDFTGRIVSSSLNLNMQTTISLSGYTTAPYKVVVYSKDGTILFSQTLIKQ